MLAVIIPTLNAQDDLPSLLTALGEERVIISDGGSSDKTLELAVSAGTVIARGTAGRGVQMARGAELAAAVEGVTHFLFLHADSTLFPGWKDALQPALDTPQTAWYFRYRPSGKGVSVFCLRFLVWLRGWAWTLPYGDQGLLVSREMYDAIGGYDRDKPLFEDVDIIDRIKSKFGRKALQKLPISLGADISDHLRQGIWSRGSRNFKLLRDYRKGVEIDQLLRRYE